VSKSITSSPAANPIESTNKPKHYPVHINRKDWAGLAPNGMGKQKPNHYFEMAKTIWENRDNLPYAWRILSRGVCDGCALGVAGLKDWTMPGPHLCSVRLNLLRLNTMSALDEKLLEDVSALEKLSSKELRALGRLPHPMLRRKGEKGFRRIGWEEAYELAAQYIRKTSPQRLAFYLTSRGLTNEVYYVAQKAVRFLGSNNIDNAARICHSPSTVALNKSLGAGASSVSYTDWIGTDLLVFVGSNAANDQPITTKYMYYARQQNTKIVAVNTYREPGMERYWIPSAAESALFGTKLTDEFFMVHTGGDLAFFNGVLKELIERDAAGQDALDHAFIAAHTDGFDEVLAALRAADWSTLIEQSGSTRKEINHFADLCAASKNGILVWSMGVTQHAHGVETVHALINLALARGWFGHQHAGMMPIRGHSGVQGGAEMGAYATSLPGTSLNAESAAHFSEMWGFPVAGERGLDAMQQLRACRDGEIDVLYSAGGNFLETIPDPQWVRGALEKVPLRIHQDIVLTSQMFVEPKADVLLFPAMTRYEQPGGGTETTTERRIAFSPEIPGPRIGEAKAEWQIFMELAQRTYPERAAQIHFDDCQAIRNEIAIANPNYAGIENLQRSGEMVQWGGTRLYDDGAFRTPNGRAQFKAVTPPQNEIPQGKFKVSTRRGKQFNSMVHAKKDPITGALRDDVLMAASDAAQLNLGDGDRILVKNEHGEFKGKVKIAQLRPRNLQMHWPEANVLLNADLMDRAAGVPDYNALVEVLPLREG
jgi:molybdopterin-dependent oxidoreductase alpha subunit